MKKKAFFAALAIFSGILPLYAQQNYASEARAGAHFFDWIHAVSACVIGLSLLSVPIIIWPFLYKNERWRTFRPLVLAIVIFTSAAGITLLVEATRYWWTENDFSTWMRLTTAIISLITIAFLIKITPKLWREKDASGLEKLVAERTSELSTLNQRLQLEIESRKLAEREVAKREKRFRALIENITDGIVVNDEDTKVLYQSPSVTRILGYTLEDRHRRPVRNYVHDDDRNAFLKLYEDLATQPGQPLPFQFRFRHKDGHYIWLEGVVTNLLHDRNVNGYVANYRDISERKKSEDSLRQEQYLLRTLIDNLPDYIYVKDTELRHIINNKANVELIGATSEAETIGKTVLDYFDPAIADEFMEYDRKVLSSGRPVLHLEEKISDQNNEVRWLLTSKIPLVEQDQIIGLIGISRDITERKKAELVLKELNVSLALQASKLAASNMELERFAYVASHDLQEPLRMVRSFLQLLKKQTGGSIDEQSHQYIDYAVEGADRMKQMITDLLDYSRIGVVQEKIETVDMNAVVQRTIEMLQETIKATQATFKVKSLPTVTGVKTELDRLFQNLISNALKYQSASLPEIIIDGLEDQYQWKFSVSDNGIGIDSRFFDKIFVIFQRLNNEGVVKGTGIGLAICKKIVESHGGKIWIESEPEAGSTFHFTISNQKLEN